MKGGVPHHASLRRDYPHQVRRVFSHPAGPNRRNQDPQRVPRKVADKRGKRKIDRK
jgi:hypothetical protein